MYSWLDGEDASGVSVSVRIHQLFLCIARKRRSVHWWICVHDAMMATPRFVMCANSGTANTIGSIPSTWRLAVFYIVAGLETAVAPLILSLPLGASPDDIAIRQANSSSRSVVWADRLSNVCLDVSCHKHSVKGDSLGQVRCE